MERSLKSIIDNEAKEYAIYTVENRAIPNLIDGLKPVQRFFLYRALELSKQGKEKFHKLASIAGGVADAGYHHGESSAQEAGALMANTWNNNYPLLDGQGNFGSRLVQQAAASRYIFCRVSKNFYAVHKDFEVMEKHEDEEHLPPKFYLPVIPTVLLNGVRGIATGYSTSILPHSFASVVQCTKLALKGELNKEPEVCYPKFNGVINKIEDGSYELIGTYKFISKTVINITEVPYKWDRAKYVEKVLDPLEDSGKISYEDDCSREGFGFKVKLLKEFRLEQDEFLRHKQILQEFKLIERVSQYIVVIDENGKLNDKFKSASDLINHFVMVRERFVQKRIEYNKKASREKFNLALAKAKFIKAVIDGQIVISGKSKNQLSEELSNDSLFEPYVPQLIGMSVYYITTDEYEKLKQEAKKLKDEYDYWCNTTSKAEYLKDLEAIS